MKKQDINYLKNAYTEIESVCEKYSGFRSSYGNGFGDIETLKESAKNHLLILEWFEKYGIEVGHSTNLFGREYAQVGSYGAFNYFRDAKQDYKKGSGRFISWSDDNSQPNNEWIYSISFPTGAYIFGENYSEQQQIFKDFFTELKSYNPDFTDSHNNCLYWKIENASKIYNEFNSVLQKYCQIFKDQFNQRKIDRLKKELEKAEAELE